MKKNRTVRWDKATDDEAKDLARSSGYYPEKENGGISRLLSDLVKQAREKGERVKSSVQNQKHDAASGVVDCVSESKKQVKGENHPARVAEA